MTQHLEPLPCHCAVNTRLCLIAVCIRHSGTPLLHCREQQLVTVLAARFSDTMMLHMLLVDPVCAMASLACNLAPILPHQSTLIGN
jgi:hypothetical protein